MTSTVNALSGRWLIVGQHASYADDAESLQWALEDEGCTCALALPTVNTGQNSNTDNIGDAFGIDMSQPNWTEILLHTLDHKHNPFTGLVVISDNQHTGEFNGLFHHASTLHLPCWQVMCGNYLASSAEHTTPRSQNPLSPNIISLAAPLDDHTDDIIEQLRAYNEQTTSHTLRQQQHTLSTLSANQRYQHVFGLLRKCLQKVLGVDNTAVTPHSSFVDLGVNSLKMLPLRDTLTELTGLPIQVSELYDYHSPDSLVAMLLARFALSSETSKASEETASSRKPETTTQTPVAIIGMACHFPPNLKSPEAFYHALLAGHDATNGAGCDGANNTTKSNAAFQNSSREQTTEKPQENEQEQPFSNAFFNQALLDNIYEFDAPFFGISPREARATDPQQRLLLTLSWQALHNACVNIANLNGTATGTFVAIGEPDYRATPNAQTNSNGLITTGTHTSMAAGRIAHILGLQGPALVINTACSSSLVAVDSACTALERGDCDMAIAGGANLMLSDEGTVGMTMLGALSPGFQCRSFDANANGYVRGEGGAMVVLKKLSDARRNNDNIRAVILGSAVNHDGKSQGLTAPSGLAQQKVIRTALNRAGVASHSITYVETHGTGTPLGDPIELHALQNAYNAAETTNSSTSSTANNNSRTEPLKVGSHKPNIGHLEQAAGITGLVKTVLCLEQQQLPGNIHFDTPNPQIDWANIRIQVVNQNQPWRTENQAPLRAGVSSFGFSGTNCHIIVEAAQSTTSQKNTVSPQSGISTNQSRSLPHSPHLLMLSAHHPEALQVLAQRYLTQLQHQDEANTSRICYTASKLTLYRYRFACSGNTNEELVAQLRNRAESNTQQPSSTPASQFMPQVAFVFAGQGSQYSGMAAKWYESNAAFKATLDRCDALARPWLNNVSLAELLTAPKTADKLTTKDTPHLHHTRWTQPALFAFHAAMLAMWQDFGAEPAIVAGHSLGEYSAAYAAGVLSLEDGLQILCERGRLIASLDDNTDHKNTGAMIALQGKPDTLNHLLTTSTALTTLFNDNQIAIAAKNSPTQIVLSGFAAPIQQVIDIIHALPEQPENAISITQLNVSHGFHSPQMNSILTPFREFLANGTTAHNGITFHAPKLTLISNLTGKPITKNQCQTPEYWAQHLRETVLFDATCQWLQQHADIIVEVGGNHTLRSVLAPQLKPESRAETTPPVLCSGKRNRSAAQDIAQLLGDLFCAGAECKYDVFFNARSNAPQLYPPPLYPMREQALKLPQAQRFRSIVQGSKAEEKAQSGFELNPPPPESQWLYKRHWQPVDENPDLNHYPEEIATTRVQIVILADHNNPLAQAVENTAFSAFASTVARFSQNDEVTHYLQSLKDNHSDTSVALLDLRHVCSSPDSNSKPFDPETTDITEAATSVVTQTVLLLQTLAKAQSAQAAINIRYWLSTQLAQQVADGKTGKEETAPVLATHLAPLWGLGRALAMEQPESWGGLIDVDHLSVQNSTELATNLLHLILAPYRSPFSNTKNHGLQQWAIRGVECRLFQAQMQRASTVSEHLNQQLHRAAETGPLKSVISPDRTIILTAGLGFIGQQFMATLVAAGAKYLVLTTRQPEPTLPAQVKRFRDQGVNIAIINNCDLCNPQSCETLLEQASQLAPLGGIVHLAGHLEDATLASINTAQIAATFASKITSGWQLHCASQQYELDFFALFSSAASVFGSPGQSIYAAANSYLEALAQHRKQQGLPANTLHWGAIEAELNKIDEKHTVSASALGMYGKLDSKQQQRLGQSGLTPLPAKAAMTLFLQLIQESRVNQNHAVSELTIIDINWQQWSTKLTQTGKPIAAQFTALLNSQALTTKNPPATNNAHPIKALIAQARAVPTEQHYELLQQHITRLLLTLTSNTLQLPSDEIDVNMPLTDQGLDSIMSMEIISDIRTQLNFMLYPNELARFGSITLLADYLTQELVPKTPEKIEQTAFKQAAKQKSPKTDTFVPVLPDQKLSHTSFVLSTPRAGSTLLRAMLAGHSRLFVPPELHLLSYGTMAERASALAKSDLSEGLQRAFMEFGLSAEQAADTIHRFEQQNAPVWQVYQALQKQLNGSVEYKNQRTILIDKSPVYAANKAVLHAADAMFANASYIHLVRHPLAVMESFVRMRMHQVAGEQANSPHTTSLTHPSSNSAYALAEQIWREYNQNIVEFFSGIEQSISNDPRLPRILTLRYEDLVAEPAPYMQQIAGMLSVPYQASMLTPYEGKRMTNGVHGHSMGVGDPNFLQHNRIDQQQAEKWQQLDLPVTLHKDTIALAERLGYHIPAQYRREKSNSKQAQSNLPSKQNNTACNVSESFFKVQDHELCLCQWGTLNEPEQPVALLVHGLQDQATIWQWVAEQLVSEGWLVFAPDLRGHGRSSHSEPGYSYPLLNYVSDLVQTVAHIQSQVAHTTALHLAGHSLGSAICATYSHLHGEQLAQLTLVEPILISENRLTSDSNMPHNVKNNSSLRSGLQLSLRNIQQSHQHTPLTSVEHAADLLQQSTPALSATMARQLAQRATVPVKGSEKQVIWRWDPILTSREGMGFPGTRQQYLQLLSEIHTPKFSVILGANSPFNRPADLNDLHSAVIHGQNDHEQKSRTLITTVSGTHTLPTDNPGAIAQHILNVTGAST